MRAAADVSQVPTRSPAGQTAAGRLHVRAMTAADLPAVDAIEQDVQPFPWRSGQFAGALDAGYLAWIFTGADQTAPVGYAVLVGVLDEWELLTFALARSHQGQGLGGEALDILLAHIRGQGGRCLFLEVASANTPALGLYRSRGFRTVGQRRAYYRHADGRTDDAWVMRCDLVPGDSEQDSR